MKIKKIQVVFLLFVLTLAVSVPLHSEHVGDAQQGYSVDLPEGYRLVQSSGKSRYIFQHTLVPVGLQIALYPRNQFQQPDQLAEHVAKQLRAQAKLIAFPLNGMPAAAVHLDFTQQNEKKGGWCLVQLLPEQKGWLVLLTYTAKAFEKAYEPLMISTLDSVFTGPQTFFEPGPMTQAVYPKEGVQHVQSTFNGQKLSFYFDAADSEANQSVIDREFALLTRYLNSPLMQAAWQRYYRIIYRDSFSRCRTVALGIEKNLISVADAGKLPAARETASAVLAWLQSFTYTRQSNDADFVNIPAVCAGKTGDCDSRAVLMAAVLNHIGIDTIVLISPKHRHAVAAVDCEGEGARFTHKGKRYLIAETTAAVPIGMIAQDFADASDWFAVDWY